MCMWTMRVKNMLVFMVILKLGLISGLPCQYCWPRDGQREIASCDKGPSKCVQMMGLTFSSNIREIRVYSCEVRILGVNLKGIMVRNRRGKECTYDRVTKTSYVSTVASSSTYKDDRVTKTSHVSTVASFSTYKGEEATWSENEQQELKNTNLLDGEEATWSENEQQELKNSNLLDGEKATRSENEQQEPKNTNLLDGEKATRSENEQQEPKNTNLLDGVLSWAIVVTIFLNVSVAIIINLKIKIRHITMHDFDHTELQDLSIDTPGHNASTIPPPPLPSPPPPAPLPPPPPQPNTVNTPPVATIQTTPPTVKPSTSLWLPVSENTRSKTASKALKYEEQTV